ncbi:hypothetical protein CYMTET_41879 [Cymbomonas tetramitiformis]|uniref:Uncharacterized protein n=1 Tax=Cymbomonas tetramitiformis TaxID=36881 RepID=A0AAE0F1J3_9CHLO|nr:hypothetical protein CYMTET_41879 [Cymbomonas tetramitiformis]
MGTLEELVGRRVRTPGVVFQVPGVYFLGRVKSVAREREDSLNLLYDDGGYYWFPRESVMRWLRDGSEEDGNVSDDLEHEVDEDEEEESGRSGHDTATTLNGLAHTSRARVTTDSEETPEDRRVRLDTTKLVEETAESISAGFKENARMPETPVEFKSNADSETYTTPPDDHTPGLLKNFVKDKPADIEEGMWYVFKLLLPLREYWNVVSQYSLLYAETKKAGEDTNAQDTEKNYGVNVLVIVLSSSKVL